MLADFLRHPQGFDLDRAESQLHVLELCEAVQQQAANLRFTSEAGAQPCLMQVQSQNSHRTVTVQAQYSQLHWCSTSMELTPSIA
eukprot:59089-Pyramimonas_sp.AAC.1